MKQATQLTLLRLFHNLGLSALFVLGLGLLASQASAQGTTASPTNGLVCTSTANGPAPVSVSFNPGGGSFSANSSKNSVSNPIVLATVKLSLSGCTLFANGSTSQGLAFYLPGLTGSGVALRSPLTGISNQIVSSSPSIAGSGGVNCAPTSQITNSYSIFQASFFTVGFNNPTASPTVFVGCNFTFTYTMAFYANPTLNSTNGTGDFTTALFNALTTNMTPAGDIGWGRLQSTYQGQSSINTYSYQLSGPGFHVSLESCTPAVSVNGSTTATVILPTVASTRLNGAGQTTGTTPFSISLKNCYNTGSNYSATAYWTYTSFSGTFPNVIANAASTSPATAVGVQISETTTGSPVLANNATGATIWNINSGTNTAPGQTFNAYYYSTGTTNLTGNVTGAANYTMSYN